jgi:hypothetical protein
MAENCGARLNDVTLRRMQSSGLLRKALEHERATKEDLTHRRSA